MKNNLKPKSTQDLAIIQEAIAAISAVGGSSLVGASGLSYGSLGSGTYAKPYINPGVLVAFVTEALNRDTFSLDCNEYPNPRFEWFEISLANCSEYELVPAAPIRIRRLSTGNLTVTAEAIGTCVFPVADSRLDRLAKVKQLADTLGESMKEASIYVQVPKSFLG